jgi:hypothetical protein
MSKHKNNDHDSQELPGLEKEVRQRIKTNRLPNGMPCLELIKAETARLGLPDSDAQGIHDAWLTNGYKTARGLQIKDWKAAIRTWFANDWFPSQKRKRRTRTVVEHLIPAPPPWTPPMDLWTPPTLEEVIEHAKTMQRDIRTMPEAATRRATKLAKWCYAHWVGNKWRRFGQPIDSTEQWKALMVEMREELNRLNK